MRKFRSTGEKADQAPRGALDKVTYLLSSYCQPQLISLRPIMEFLTARELGLTNVDNLIVK